MQNFEKTLLLSFWNFGENFGKSILKSIKSVQFYYFFLKVTKPPKN